MNPEQQRIAIAEICGWRLVEDNPDFEPYWEEPKGNMIAVGSAMHRLPDYLSDLNAMHEAEKILGDNQMMGFRGELVEMMRPKYGFESACLLAIHATAAQRAEAFLRTVGRWEE
jgi:hypothetical protein